MFYHAREAQSRELFLRKHHHLNKVVGRSVAAGYNHTLLPRDWPIWLENGAQAGEVHKHVAQLLVPCLDEGVVVVHAAGLLAPLAEDPSQLAHLFKDP
jgi:hypothetical protein